MKKLAVKISECCNTTLGGFIVVNHIRTGHAGVDLCFLLGIVGLLFAPAAYLFKKLRARALKP